MEVEVGLSRPRPNREGAARVQALPKSASQPRSGIWGAPRAKPTRQANHRQIPTLHQERCHRRPHIRTVPALLLLHCTLHCTRRHQTAARRPTYCPYGTVLLCNAHSVRIHSVRQPLLAPVSALVDTQPFWPARIEPSISPAPSHPHAAPAPTPSAPRERIRRPVRRSRDSRDSKVDGPAAARVILLTALGQSCTPAANLPIWSAYASFGGLDALDHSIRVNAFFLTRPSSSQKPSNTLFCKSHKRTHIRSTEIGLLWRRHARYSNLLGFLSQLHQPSFGAETGGKPSKSNIHSRLFLAATWRRLGHGHLPDGSGTSQPTPSAATLESDHQELPLWSKSHDGAVSSTAADSFRLVSLPRPHPLIKSLHSLPSLSQKASTFLPRQPFVFCFRAPMHQLHFGNGLTECLCSRRQCCICVPVMATPSHKRLRRDVGVEVWI